MSKMSAAFVDADPRRRGERSKHECGADDQRDAGAAGHIRDPEDNQAQPDEEGNGRE
jgi:hypothetical protein